MDDERPRADLVATKWEQDWGRGGQDQRPAAEARVAPAEVAILAR
jgi:hypothetical protein